MKRDPLTEDELLQALQSEATAACGFYDTTVYEEQAEAIKYYQGEPFGDEVDGLSQIVLKDVAETVDYMTISVGRLFVAGDRVCEFEAKDESEAEAVDQATAAMHQIFMQDQDGYRILMDWLKAGLIEKYCATKTAMVEEESISTKVYTGTADDLMAAEERGELPEDAEVTQGEDGTFRVKIKTKAQKTRFYDYPLPSEEFRFSARARHEDDADYLAHVCRKTRSELVEMGFDADMVYELSTEDDLLTDQRRAARDDWQHWRDDNVNPSMQEVTLWEEYIKIDADGDGIAERLKVFRVADKILKQEEVDDHPFVIFTPFPRPHRIVGDGLADKTMDIQRIRSVVARQLMNGMYLSNMPRYWVPQESVNENTYNDLLTVIPGSPVRGKGVAPTPLNAGFDAGRSINVMEFWTGERESRTGITRLNQGLDADALNKMLCVETPVPMASGAYKLLADVEDNDWLIGSDGGSVRVVKAHEIHDPERAYRIRFSSGEEIDAGGEHLWTVQTDNDKRYNKFQTVDTDRLFEMMQGRGLVYIPRVQRPLTGAERELPLDPYLLGTWLGDGSLHAPRITTMEAETVAYTEAWAEEYGGLTIDKQQNSGAAKTYYVKGLYPILRGMKMLKRGDADRDAGIVGKHIPEEYFHASYRQRLELLRGLMDTDGCHHSNALCVFVQKGGKLLDDAVRLIESLGGWPSVRPATAAGCYQVTFSLADCPFRLSRKAEHWRPAKANAATQVVKSIERIAIKPMRCLTVDASDGLFCVGRRFTVTHNTASGTAMMQAQGQQFEEYIARNFAECFARLMWKKYRLVKEFGKPFKLKMDGEYQQVDPAMWPDEPDMVIRVGMGTGRKEYRLALRMQLLDIQREGLEIGMVKKEHLFNNAGAIVRDAGLGQPDDYFVNPAKPELDAEGNPIQEEPKPDPEMAKVEAEAQLQANKLQGEQAMSAAKMQMMQQEAALKLQLQREEAEAQAQLARDKATFEAQQAEQRFAFEQEMATRQFQQDSILAQQRADNDAKMKKYREGGSLAE